MQKLLQQLRDLERQVHEQNIIVETAASKLSLFAKLHRLENKKHYNLIQMKNAVNTMIEIKKEEEERNGQTGNSKL